MEKTNFRIFFMESYPSEGVAIEIRMGCNGSQHAICTSRLYFEANGEVGHAADLGTKSVGLCDGRSCEPLGRFEHEVEEE